jgi:phenylpropionate dioxygenase-like ring-hydroxylating dioxygenase large terminal subunit
VHKNSKACATAYPTVVQNNILWFYPRAGAEHRDVLRRKRPPYIPEIDDPSFVTVYGIRDLSCGWVEEVEHPTRPLLF